MRRARLQAGKIGVGIPAMQLLQKTVCAVLFGFAVGASAAPGPSACKNLKSRDGYLACLRELAQVGEKAAGMTPGGDHKKIGAVEVWMKSSGTSTSGGGGVMTCTKHGAVTTCTTGK